MKQVCKLLLPVAVFFGFALSAAAQDWAKAKVEASPRHHEWVTVTHDGRKVETYIAYPAAPDKRPVVLVIHEIFGHTDWVEEMCDDLAAAGYVAVSPDLLSGAGPNGGGTQSLASQSDIGRAINSLPPDQITADLNAAADYALKLPASSGKLYVAGFCWGGTQTFRYATNRPDLAGAFVFYGTPPDDASLARIKAPVYGFYPQNDARTTATIPDTTTKMKALGKDYEPVTYAGADHGFMRLGEDPNGTAANKKARDDSWARLVSLLSK